ncbi:hypothetical protein MASSI9I_20778 [Massilia sp. 9I]|nr:hypothetical protein MASSI9I_20778 [Massilia sp. 9I]
MLVSLVLPDQNDHSSRDIRNAFYGPENTAFMRAASKRAGMDTGEGRRVMFRCSVFPMEFPCM